MLHLFTGLFCENFPLLLKTELEVAYITMSLHSISLQCHIAFLSFLILLYQELYHEEQLSLPVWPTTLQQHERFSSPKSQVLRKLWTYMWIIIHHQIGNYLLGKGGYVFGSVG